jgi:exonuclease III
VRIVSWNIAFRGTKAAKRQGKLLQQLAPDLILLQECQIAPKCDPLFAAKNDPFDGAETGGAEPHIAEQSRSWRAASGEREVMRGS